MRGGLFARGYVCMCIPGYCLFTCLCNTYACIYMHARLYMCHGVKQPTYVCVCVA